MPRRDNVKLRHGTAADWVNGNPVLGLGEVGVETDTGQLKAGNDQDHWVDRPYAGGSGDSAGLATHIADLANPHAVTKTQVGLGNADNTADADKPVSTAQATALAGKQASGNYITALTGDVTASGPGSVAATIGSGKVTNAMLAGSIAASKLIGSDITIAESQVTGLVSALSAKADDSGVAHLVGHNVFLPPDAATVPVTIQGFTGQTANLLEFKNPAGTLLSYYRNDGLIFAAGITGGIIQSTYFTDGANSRAYFDSSVSGQGWTMVNRTASNKAFVIQGASSQSANILELQNSSGTALGFADATANVYAPSFNTQGSSGQVALFDRGGSGNYFALYCAGDWGVYDTAGSFTSWTLQAITGRMGVNNQSPGAQIHAIAKSASTIGAIIQGATSQSANVLELQTSAGTAFAEFMPTGSYGHLKLTGPSGQSNGSGLNFVSNGGTYTGLFTLDGSGNMVFRNSNASGGTYFDYQFGTFFRNASSVVVAQFNSSTSSFQVNAATASTVAQVIRGAASQTGNLLELQDSSASGLSFFDKTGQLTIGPYNANSRAQIIFGAATSSYVKLLQIGTTLRLYKADESALADFYCASLIGSGTISAIGASSQIGVNRRDTNAAALAIYSGSGDGQFNMTGIGDVLVCLAGGGVKALSAVAGSVALTAQLAASPTADAIQVQTSTGTVLTAFDKLGAWKPPHMADSAAANDTTYYSTTASKLVYKDSGGTVNALY